MTEIVVIGCAKGRKGIYRSTCYGADSVEQAVRIAKQSHLRWAFIEDVNNPARVPLQLSEPRASAVNA